MYDLQSSIRQPLVFKTDEKSGIRQLDGLIELRVYNPDSCLNSIQRAMSQRLVSKTSMNESSSRSHLIVSFKIVKYVSNQESESKVFSIVDLAGSERVHLSHVQGKEFKEATHINNSLMVIFINLKVHFLIIKLEFGSPHSSSIRSGKYIFKTFYFL